jgi:hypothetical protein
MDGSTRFSVRVLLAGVGASLAIGCGGTEAISVAMDGGEDALGVDAASNDSGVDSGSDAGAPSGSCHSVADCPQVAGQGPEECLSPNARGGCVAMTTTGCTSDSQCDAGDVCRSDPWAGSNPSPTVCVPPCTGADECSPLDQCTGDGHCLPYTCESCPSYYSCLNGACTIPNCTTDSDCPGGYCVDGACAPSLGVCGSECV